MVFLSEVKGGLIGCKIVLDILEGQQKGGSLSRRPKSGRKCISSKNPMKLEDQMAKGWRPRGVGRPKFHLFFFSSSSLKSHSLRSLSGCGMSMVFEVVGPSKMHVWSSLGHHVRTRRTCLVGPPGVSHDDPESPNVHFGGHQSFKTPPKFNEKTLKGAQRVKFQAVGKKRAKFWGCAAEGVSG